MKTIAEKVAEYDKLQREICEHFGIERSMAFEFYDVGWWFITGNGVGQNLYYGFGKPDEMTPNEVYGGDIYHTSVWRKEGSEDFTMVIYDNGCGEKPVAIFSNALEVTDEDFQERALDY